MAARQKSEKILNEYQYSLNKQLDDHKKEKENQIAFEMKVEEDSIRRENNKELSKAQLEIKKRLSKRHDELKNMLFSELFELVGKYRSTEEYKELLVNQIKKALEFAKSKPLKIYIDPKDEHLKQELEDRANTSLYLSEYEFMGGTRAVISESNILIDNSFESKIAELKENFSLDGGNLNG
ncbi:MAG TPA: V-type ATP synthase subunit E [Candidatus Merdenecus merdavium]|nr:V-type ATP synthase subunit E [Candidatus Merdenecus merdavium]